MRDYSSFENNNKSLVKPLDLLVVLIVLLFCVCPLILRGKSSPEYVSISLNGNTILNLDMHTDTLVTVVGECGLFAVRIKNCAASIESSKCPEQICVHAHPISRTGESIICVPNRIIITIQGRQRDSFDAIIK